MTCTAFVNSDNVVEVVVTNLITGEFVNDATVTVTVLDAFDAEVSGQVWPTSADYVLASDGIYRAALNAAAALVWASKYTAVIDIDTIDGVTAQLRCPFTASVQGCAPVTNCA
jgi:hypothetical protein